VDAFCIRAAVGVALTVTVAAPLASDFFCPVIPLADEGLSSQLRPVPLVDSSTIASRPTPLVSVITPGLLSSILRSLRPLQQVNVVDAVSQSRKVEPTLRFSPGEQKRQVQSAPCNLAYDHLLQVFTSSSTSMGFPEGTSPREGLGNFVSWYLSPWLSADNLKNAQPVVKAENEFEKACLRSEVPAEMNPDLIKRAVGVLSYETQPFCTALRATDSEVITARHCFSSEDGKLQPQTESALAHGGHIWFQYEGEPQNRYEVCEQSLPRATNVGFLLHQDNIRVKIAKTQLPAVPWRWYALPLRQGISLYIRGYFPFASEATILGRMRATAFGGCASIAADERCVFHACQSTPIMSGAPVFFRPEPGTQSDHLELVALHLGPAAIASASASGGAVCEKSDGALVNLSNFAYQPEGY